MCRESLKDRAYRTLDLGAVVIWRDIGRALRDCRSVLDLGCGARSPMRHLPRPERLVGVDGHRPAIDESRRLNIHDEYVECNVLDVPFEPRSFDAVVMLDLLEHLSNSDGLALLDRAEEIAARRVVILTPNGWLPQDEYGGNPLQRHQSAWSAADLIARGYAIRGVNGHKAFRGQRGAYRGPAVIGGPLASASELLVYRRPEQAFHLLAIKTIK